MALVVAPAGHADDAQDQQFLDYIHLNNLPGQDDSLIAYAHQYCDTGPPYFAAGPLLLQGVRPEQIYVVKVAASRAYCPEKIPIQTVEPSPFFDP